MLSRRNVRIKVMQMLYTANRDGGLTYNHVERAYKQRVDNSYKTYLFNIHFLIKVAGESKHDEDRRKAKLLPGEEDLNFKAILANNPAVDSLTNNTGFFQLLKQYKLTSAVNQDIAKQLYLAFAESAEYKAYVAKPVTSLKEHVDMLSELYRFCTKHELFHDSIEDVFPNWIDDDSLVMGATKKTLKKLPVDEFFFKEFKPDYETVEEYGMELLYKVSHLDDDLLELIKPKLQNWEVERVAILDMILIKMALSEFLHFPTIPTKVTLNEYVEISKMYSTPKSKDFINGILDRLLKQLMKEGKINKLGRGLKS
ncbi:MAG: transcription antitermination factor NusB [Saprospiraceae bacterium]